MDSSIDVIVVRVGSACEPGPVTRHWPERRSYVPSNVGSQYTGGKMSAESLSRDEEDCAKENEIEMPQWG